MSVLQSEINCRYLRVMAKRNFVDFTSPAVVQGQAGPAPPPQGHCYNLNPLFLDQTRQKPWFTTASNQISVSDITVVEDWLKNGAAYSAYTDPARFLKLLLNDETGRFLNSMLA